jgi:hypothetical protein
MSKSSTDEATLEKIHAILDNIPSKSPDKKQDQYLTSLQRRLTSHQKTFHPTQYRSTDLTPRVIIRRKQELEKQIREEKKQEVRFKEVKIETKIIPSSDISVSDDALFEVENPSLETEKIPEFIEVKPEQEKVEQLAVKEEPLTVKISSEKKEDESLPQWHAVEEEALINEPSKPSIEHVKKKAFLKSKRKPSKELTKEEETESWVEWESTPEEDNKKTNIWEPLSSEKKEKTTSKTIRYKKISGKKRDKDEEEMDSSSDVHDSKNSTFSPIDNKRENNKLDEETISDDQGFRFNGYNLYKKVIKINDEDNRIIHFFAKEPPETGEPTTLPKGYEVKINRRTGVPYIRKKQN